MSSSSPGFTYRLLSCVLVSTLVAQGPCEGLALAQAASASRMTHRHHVSAPVDPAPAAPIAESAPPAGSSSPVPSSPPVSLAGPPAPSPGPFDVLPVSVQPRSVAWVTAPAQGGADPWALFDGRGDAAFGAPSSDPVNLSIGLASPTRLAEVTVLGPTEGTLTVWAEEGGTRHVVESLDHVTVRARAGEWKRVSAQGTEPASNLDVEWAPASPTGPAGLGLWGLSSPVREATDTQLADRVLAGALPGTFVAKGSPDQAQIARVDPGAAASPRDGEFAIHVDADPRTWAHAFLVYELTGLGHFTQAIRQINGGTPRGGAGATASEGGLQVEEIDPAWLHKGDNEVRFLPLPEAGSPDYAVRNVRIVGAGSTSLVEARMANSSNGGSRTQQLAFETASKPHDVVFELLEPSQAHLSLSTAGSGKAGTMQVDLKGLEPGWHRVGLDALPASTSVNVALEPKKGASAIAAPREGMVPDVSEVVMTASALPHDSERIAVAYPLHGECRDHHAWVTGFVGGANDSVAGLRANGIAADVGADGSFAVDVPEAKASHDWTASLEATMASGKILRRELRLSACEDAGETANPDTTEDEGAPLTTLVRAGEKKTITYAGATLDIPAGAVDHDVRISVRPLVPAQLAQMSPGLVNVSPGHRAYRFGPHGLKFRKPVKLTLPYDPAAFTNGLSERGVFGYYYDESLTRWERVGRFGVAEGGALTSLTEHFTDFISGILAMPDEPGVKSFNSTEMSGIKVGDPAAGLGLISIPEANSTGAATLSYPFEVPPGRHGIQPNLALTYNSQRGNGWVGEGWDISGLSAISIDTRFGVPHYDEEHGFQSLYVLDGAELTPTDPTTGPNGTNSSVHYERRVEGRYDTIVRQFAPGGEPCVTGWTVTDKQGTVFTYGGTNATLADPANSCHAARWYLASVTDTFKNQMTITYAPDPNQTAGAAALYPSAIDYTSNTTGLVPTYGVRFYLGSQPRTDVVSNGRYGFLERTALVLDHVDVVVDAGTLAGTIIRRYQLAYHQDNLPQRFQKSLLQSITQKGVGAAAMLDQHTFDYGMMPLASDGTSIEGFGPLTEPWGTETTDDGLSQVSSNLTGGASGGGLAIPFVSATINGGGANGDDTVGRLLLDINGDGVPDLMENSGQTFLGLANPSLYGLAAGPNGNTNLQSATKYPIKFFLGHTNKSTGDTSGNVDSAFGGFGGSYGSTSVEDDVISVDVDGDGLIDQAAIQNGSMIWSKNCGDSNHSFANSQLNSFTGQYTAPQCPQNLVTPQALPGTPVSQNTQVAPPPAMPPTGGIVRMNPLVRWTPPFFFTNGLGTPDLPPNSSTANPTNIVISGPVQKSVAGGNGVDVFIYEGSKPIWGVTLMPNDTSPCFPTNSPPVYDSNGIIERGTQCGTTNGFQLNLISGDDFFFMTRAHQSSNPTPQELALESVHNDVKWDPIIQYVDDSGNPVVQTDAFTNGSVNGAVNLPNAVEPYAGLLPFDGSLFQFDQQGDFSLAGPAHVDWIATMDGTVHVYADALGDNSFTTGNTSDSIATYIVGIHENSNVNATENGSSCVSPGVTIPDSGVVATGQGSGMAGSVPMSADICVHVGDVLQFQVNSRSPIDISQIHWQPTVHYTTICRPSSTANNTVSCNPVTCDPATSTCQITGSDPDSDVPPPFSVVQQQMQPFFAVVSPETVSNFPSPGPLRNNNANSPVYRHYVPLSHIRTPTQPNDPLLGSGATQLTISTAQTVQITGQAVASDPNGAVYVAVQGRNRLYASAVIPQGGTGTVSIDGNGATVEPGDEVMVNIYGSLDLNATTTCTNDVSSSPPLQGTCVFLDGTLSRPLPVNVLVADVNADPGATDQNAFIMPTMSGGMHGWWTGFYNGDAPGGDFVLSNVDAQPPNPQAFVYAIPQPSSPYSWTGPGGTYVAPGLFVAGRGPIRSDVNVLRHATTRNLDSTAMIGPVGAGENTGTTATDHDFFDLNGDRAADAISWDGTVQIADRNGQFFSSIGFPGVSALPSGLRAVNHAAFRGSVSTNVGTNGGDSSNVLVTDTSTDGRVQGMASSSFRTGLDYGLSTTVVDWRDMNGDGLPDALVRYEGSPNFSVQLNYGYGLGTAQSWPSGDWDSSALSVATGTSTLGTNFLPGQIAQADGQLFQGQRQNQVGFDAIRTQDEATFNVGFGGTVSGNAGFVGGAVTAGAGWSFGITRTLEDLIDVNGDGLPDEVLKVPGDNTHIHVRLNLGEKFDQDTIWTMPTWDNVDSVTVQGSFEDPGVTVFNFLGTHDDGLDFRRSKTFETNYEVQGCLLFVCADTSGFQESGNSSSQVQFEDINGDGRPDIVFKPLGSSSQHSQQVYVKLNQAPADLNLLTTVQRPLGGSFAITYGRAGNYRPDSTVAMSPPTIDEPTNKFVMSGLALSDGQGNASNNFLGNTVQRQFVYDPSGFFNRVEQEDYGFSKVTTTRLHSNASPYATEEVDYQNGDFYRKGLVSRTVTSDANGLPFIVQSFDYADPTQVTPPLPAISGVFFPAETDRATQWFEGKTTNLTQPGAQRTETRTFDAHGNLTQMTDFGGVGSNDDVTYAISYDGCLNGSSNAVPIFKPCEITAKDSFGNTLRDIKATYDQNTAAMLSYQKVIIGGVDPTLGVANTASSPDLATWTYGYDNFGNILSTTDPRGYVVSYIYDTAAQTYPVQALDSFGYLSSSIPNYLYGTVGSETDANDNTAVFNYDGFGRLQTVYGPDDMGSSEPTLSFSYSEGTGVRPPAAYATTAHKDKLHSNQPIMTATFVDGLQRTIQTKKSLAQDLGHGVTQGFAVSGTPTFDDFGRTMAQGQPTFDSTNPLTTYVPGTPLNPTTYGYDVLDRVTSTILSSANPPETTLTTYGFDKIGTLSYPATTVTDANVNATVAAGGTHPPGFAREELRDVRGDVLEVKQQNRLAGPTGATTTLTTYYGYDPVQQLLTVTDAKGNLTHAIYDTAGRMVTLISPDMGRTDFEYDLSGNLAKKQTAKLAANVQFIKYQYDFNRLREIDYPTSPPVKYTYGTAAEAGTLGLNRAGRVKQETNEAGTKTYEYDALGNVNLETFSFLKVGASGTQSTDFVNETLAYDYDSFGRLTHVFYPGPAAEIVSYGYDAGGNLDTITGVTQNGTTIPYLTHIGYDEFGTREVLVSGNGVRTTYSYDGPTHRLSQIHATEFDPVVAKTKGVPRLFQQINYSYDPVGNITQIQNTAPFDVSLTAQVRVGPVNETFTYDDLYQLSTVDGTAQTSSTSQAHYDVTMKYDAISNITSKLQKNAIDTLSSTGTVTSSAVQNNGTYTSAYTYGSAKSHAPTEVDDTVPTGVSTTPIKGSFTYDPSGNESGWTRKTSSGTTSRVLTFDEENRLTKVTQNGLEIQSSLYDALGQRATKRANDSTQTAYFGPHMTVVNGTVVTKQIFAGDTRIAAKLVPNPADEQCATCNDRPSVLYYHSDHLGSANFVTDGTQTLVEHEEYYPSGEVWVDQENTTAGLPQPYLFNGKELDTETGLYYFGARYYDPRVQIWVSPDPILGRYMQGSPNGGVLNPANLALYTYAWNNAVRLNDLNGREPHLPGTPCTAERCEDAVFIPIPSDADVVAAGEILGSSLAAAGARAGALFTRLAAWLGFGAAVAKTPAAERVADTIEQAAPELDSVAPTLESRVEPLAEQGVGAAEDALVIGEEQFGAKIGKHAVDYGLNPGSAADRETLRGIIRSISNNPDQVVQGNFKGQEGLVDFFIKGSDVVIGKGGEFVTLMKDGINNPAVRRAMGLR